MHRMPSGPSSVCELGASVEENLVLFTYFSIQFWPRGTPPQYPAQVIGIQL